jgi:hypothetical protein
MMLLECRVLDSALSSPEEPELLAMRTTAGLPWPLKQTYFVAQISQAPVAIITEVKYIVFRKTRNSLKRAPQWND